MASNEREGMKTCGKCKVEKELTEFYRCKRDGVQSWCKSCKKLWTVENRDSVNTSKRKWKENNREHNRACSREYSKQWAKDNREKDNANTSKRRARVKGLTPEMNKAELVEIESMYMYNQIMPGDWHVDHIKPLAAGGLHHPSNLQVLSKFDNLSKGAKWNI